MAKVYNFRTPVTERKIALSNPGEFVQEELAMRIDDKGNETFYVKGKTNVYEKIQAFAEECKIENILARCQDLGDLTALNQIQVEYGDMTEFPSTFIEAHQKIQELEDNFNNLPLDIREKFENNFNKYLAEAGTEKWLKNLGIVEEKSAEVAEEKTEKGDKEE